MLQFLVEQEMFYSMCCLQNYMCNQVMHVSFLNCGQRKSEFLPTSSL